MRAIFRPLFGDRPAVADALLSVKSFRARLRKALVTRRQRLALMALDDRMLADIGLSRSQAFREADRALFDLPKD